jgi:hypothetical protein
MRGNTHRSGVVDVNVRRITKLPGRLPHFEVVGLGGNGSGGFGGDLSRFCTRRLDSRFQKGPGHPVGPANASELQPEIGAEDDGKEAVQKAK